MMERARSDIAQHCSMLVACELNIAARIARSRLMLPRQLTGRTSRDERLRLAEVDGGPARACGAEFTEMIATIGPPSAA
jgi:hypothetical protein